METIELIKETEQRAVSLIAEAEKNKEKAIIETKESIGQRVGNLRVELKNEINLIVEKGEKEAKNLKDRESEKRAKDIMDLDNAIKKNIGQAVSYIFNKINN